MGIMNKGVLYALWDYEPQHGDELPLREGDCLAVLRREDEEETEWWWARLQDQEGYVPRNLVAGSRVRPHFPCWRATGHGQGPVLLELLRSSRDPGLDRAGHCGQESPSVLNLGGGGSRERFQGGGRESGQEKGGGVALSRCCTADLSAVGARAGQIMESEERTDVGRWKSPAGEVMTVSSVAPRSHPAPGRGGRDRRATTS